jgi:hypothetical protein
MLFRPAQLDSVQAKTNVAKKGKAEEMFPSEFFPGRSGQRFPGFLAVCRARLGKEEMDGGSNDQR